MTVLRRIPINNGLEAYTVSVSLEEAVYDFLFRWNARDEAWYMDVSVLDSVALYGVKVINSEDLLAAYAYKSAVELLPPGRFQITDVAGTFRDPDTDTFGDDVVLIYEDTSV